MVADADEIVLLENGRILEHGNHQTLLAQRGPYHALTQAYAGARHETNCAFAALVSPVRWWIALAVLLSFGTIGASVGLMAMSAYLISKAALTIYG